MSQTKCENCGHPEAYHRRANDRVIVMIGECSYPVHHSSGRCECRGFAEPLCEAWFRPGNKDPEYTPYGAKCSLPRDHPVVGDSFNDHVFTRICSAPRHYTHLVVIFHEQAPTVTGFHDIDSARAFYGEAGTQWSESFLTKVIAGPIV